MLQTVTYMTIVNVFSLHTHLQKKRARNVPADIGGRYTKGFFFIIEDAPLPPLMRVCVWQGC